MKFVSKQFVGNFFVWGLSCWQELQIAFSQEFSLPVAKLVRRAAEMVAAEENFMVSPTMHNNVMMLLAPMLLCVMCSDGSSGLSVAVSLGLPLCPFRWCREQGLPQRSCATVVVRIV